MCLSIDGTIPAVMVRCSLLFSRFFLQLSCCSLACVNQAFVWTDRVAKLKEGDWGSYTSKFSMSGKWKLLGQTETLRDDLNPRFSEKFIVKHSGRKCGKRQLKFEFYDRDSLEDDLSKQDYIGTAECFLHDVSNSLHPPPPLLFPFKKKPSSKLNMNEFRNGKEGPEQTNMNGFNLYRSSPRMGEV